jgi:hemerythrin
MFDWKQNYAVHSRDMDTQHQKLFELAESLFVAMHRGSGRDVLNRTLDELVSYTQKHFSSEEKLMGDFGYPELASHREQHQALTRQVLDFQRSFQAGRTTITVQLLSFLKNWLEQHIIKSDMLYGEYLKSHSQATTAHR